MRDIERKSAREPDLVGARAFVLDRVKRLLAQKRDDRMKLSALHAPEVECIAKGKARTRYEIPWEVDSDPISRQSGALTPSWRRKCKRLNHGLSWPLSALILPLYSFRWNCLVQPG